MRTKKYFSVAIGLILAFSSFATAFAETVSNDVTPEPTAFYTTEANADTQTQEQMITDSGEMQATEQPSAAPETTAQPDETLPEASGIPAENQQPDAAAEATAAPTPAVPDTNEPQPVRSADIHITIPTTPQYGDTVTLQATLNGYDGVPVSLQWQYSRDQEHWTDARGNGANGMEYSFQINDDTVCTYWRLAVTTA